MLRSGVISPVLSLGYVYTTPSVKQFMGNYDMRILEVILTRLPPYTHITIRVVVALSVLYLYAT